MLENSGFFKKSNFIIDSTSVTAIEIKYEYEYKFIYDKLVSGKFLLDQEARDFYYKNDLIKLNRFDNFYNLSVNLLNKKHFIVSPVRYSYFLLVVQVRINANSLKEIEKYPLDLTYINGEDIDINMLDELPFTESLIYNPDGYKYHELSLAWDKTTDCYSCDHSGLKTKYRFVLYRYNSKKQVPVTKTNKCLFPKKK